MGLNSKIQDYLDFLPLFFHLKCFLINSQIDYKPDILKMKSIEKFLYFLILYFLD